MDLLEPQLRLAASRARFLACTWKPDCICDHCCRQQQRNKELKAKRDAFYAQKKELRSRVEEALKELRAVRKGRAVIIDYKNYQRYVNRLLSLSYGRSLRYTFRRELDYFSRHLVRFNAAHKQMINNTLYISSGFTADRLIIIKLYLLDTLTRIKRRNSGKEAR